MHIINIILHTLLMIACISPIIFLLVRELYNHLHNKAAHKEYLIYSEKISKINKKILKEGREEWTVPCRRPKDASVVMKIISCDTSHQLFSRHTDSKYQSFYNYDNKIQKLKAHLEWCKKEFPALFKAENRSKVLDSILN